MTQLCYFVQSARINQTRGSETILSDAVRFEYMGKAEFEFGALPEANRRLHSKASTLRLTIIEEVRNSDDQPLILLHPENLDVVAYGAAVRAVMDTRTSTMASTGLPDQAVTEPAFGAPRQYRTKKAKAAYFEQWRANRRSFWWDLGCDVMFSFDHAFMNDLPNHLKASWASMDLPPVTIKAAA